MNTSKFLAGILIGLVTGLLIAPEKGEDLRDEIAGSADGLRRKLHRIAGKTSHEMKDLQQILEGEVAGLGDDVRQRMLNIIKETSERANSVKKNIAHEMHV